MVIPIGKGRFFAQSIIFKHLPKACFPCGGAKGHIKRDPPNPPTSEVEKEEKTIAPNTIPCNFKSVGGKEKPNKHTKKSNRRNNNRFTALLNVEEGEGLLLQGQL